MKPRCPWVPVTDALYCSYHDTEWGVPIHNDTNIFEQLSLEVAQVGLSWRTVLYKREEYRLLFDAFEIHKVATFTDKDIQRISEDARIIRYKAKNAAIVHNAKRALEIITEYGSLNEYFWNWVKHKPLRLSPRSISDYATESDLSRIISVDLRKRGFKFIGSTNIYALLQSIGIVNDHTVDCFRYFELLNLV